MHLLFEIYKICHIYLSNIRNDSNIRNNDILNKFINIQPDNIINESFV
jgi:hypothetical protein